MYFRYEMRGVRYESLARHAFAASLGLLGSCDANTWLLTRPARTLSEFSSTGTCDAAVWLLMQLAVNRSALLHAVSWGRRHFLDTS